MKNNEEKLNHPRKLNANNLTSFFISHLNYIYCAKELLIKLLPEIKELATFSGLKHAIEEKCTEVEMQLKRLNVIYTLLNSKPSKEACNSIRGLLNDALEGIKNPNKELSELRDLSILFYLQNLEGIMMASCQALRIAAFKMKMPQIKSLLKENYVEAKETRALLMLLSSKYIASS